MHAVAQVAQPGHARVAAARTVPDVWHHGARAPGTGNQAMLRALSRIAPRVQTKLEVGAADHPLEQEADQVAAQVMRMPEPMPVVTSAPGVLRRACAACADADHKLARKAVGDGVRADAAAPASVHAALAGSGTPLAPSTRNFFEPRLGLDLGAVRIHTGGVAAQSAQAIGARAYTLGSDIVFAAGTYFPGSTAGRQLLAHELAHVVQQCDAASGAVIRRVTEDPATKRKSFDCPQFAGDTKLEACLNDADRLRPGETGESVRKVQNSLLLDGEDLGSGGISGNYDAATGQAVKAFKAKYHLGFETFPDVGPGTTAKMDDLCLGPVPAKPRQPPGTTPAVQAATANRERLSALGFASTTMLALQQAVVAGQDAAAIRKSFPSAVLALGRWLKAKPEDGDFAATVQTTLDLINRNIGAPSAIGVPPASDATCSVAPCLLDGFGCTSAAAGVNVCHGFLVSNEDCQRDVLMHEFYHSIGLHKERANRAAIAKPADAFDNADSMAELVTELAGSPTDRCSRP